MGSIFRFSPRPNRAAEINWRPWGAESFAEAGTSDRPILLCLTAVWCFWCHRMDETTYSDPGVIAFINEHFTAIRVDADQYPHVQERYVTGGWPTNAFLTPTGEVLWSGTYIEPEQFAAVVGSLLSLFPQNAALRTYAEQRDVPLPPMTQPSGTQPAETRPTTSTATAPAAL